ncbi:hypothetical protein GWI33_010157 [Rhynchophorus ferrugineus]|uniref:Uncharacterized protein n=1 Tax=Rhynchophorus ferrugineus TaxID=354439 RepID=A0A834IVA2_RHYFE|nr:hypothetical protein GWI33_010157 [Rhynchophorus ferrugineus]
MLRFFVLYVFVVGLVHGAPHRSKHKSSDRPQIIYDQKQTGEFNLQVHLKDFQIIAILGDDLLDGDYDYAYDDSDFTIKPAGSSSTTTPKPSATLTTTTTTTTPAPSSTTEKPFTTTSSPEISSTTEVKNQKLSIKGILTPNDVESEELTNLSPSSSTSEAPLTGESTPGKIKVQILGSPSAAMGELSPPAGIVPGEDIQSDFGEDILHGEIASFRRCSAGFSRDKKGRCRRVRKPSNSHLLEKLTSSLASKLKLPSSDDHIVP